MPSQKPLKILLADDNSDAIESMAMVLRLDGHRVETASNGAEAVDRATLFMPHIVILDIGMPVLNGYDTCRLIRGCAWGRKMVIAALTGWNSDKHRERTSDAGFDFHFSKPMDFDDLELLDGLYRTREPAMLPEYPL